VKAAVGQMDFGNYKVDRLPVLGSGAGSEQLFAVPKLLSGTEEAAAAAVYETAVSWGISDKS